MKILSFFRKPKPMEKTMSDKILVPTAKSALAAYMNLQAAHAEAAAKILELDAIVRDRDEQIAEAMNILAGFVDVGGSTGGVVG